MQGKNPFLQEGTKASEIRKMLSRKKQALSAEDEALLEPTNFWREYSTLCANCDKLSKHKRGYLFTGMTPSGEMKTFCGIDCCEEWEQKDDNTNSRREAIKEQKARKA